MTDIQILIQQLYDNRKLSSAEETVGFIDALEKLQKQQLLEDFIPSLFRVFDDVTENLEVMFELVLLIEACNRDKYITNLITYTKELSNHATNWAQTLYIRILNNKEWRTRLGEILAQSPYLYDISVLNMLNSIIQRNPERFETKVREILGK